jgi:hypothetical protein
VVDGAVDALDVVCSHGGISGWIGSQDLASAGGGSRAS